MKNRFLFLIPVLVLIDQLIKYLVKDRIFIIFNQPLILYSKNTGAAFGILAGNNLLLIFISVLVLILLGYFYKKEPKLRIGLAFIFAGAISNLMDRVFRGFIVDYINIWILSNFNLADVFNILGLLLILYKLKGK